MANVARILMTGTAALLLAGCAREAEVARSWIEQNLPQETYQVARNTEPTGSAFNRQLYEGYMELAAGERAEYDWGDSRHFANKALAAAEDQEVGPDPLYDRDLPVDSLDEFKLARRALTSVLERGARSQLTVDAAKAQVSFDCWAQEQEENHQSEDITACRNDFYDAIGKVQTAMGLRKDDYVVYFNSGSANPAKRQLDKVMDAAVTAKGRSLKVLVSGHTDTTGTGERNKLLGAERAEAVKKLLLSVGLKDDQIVTSAHGAAQPAVATGPGTPEPKNRRVEIKLVN